MQRYGANHSPSHPLPMANTYPNLYVEDTQDTTYLSCYAVKVSSVVVNSITSHASKDRQNRIVAMNLLMPTTGKALCAFKVLRACDSEETYHLIYENGRVEIVSLVGELITSYHCEGYAIRRYYRGRQKTNFYERLQKTCDTNYKVYEAFCRYADQYKHRTEQFITDIVNKKVTLK